MAATGSKHAADTTEKRAVDLPGVSSFFLHWFRKQARRELRRGFHQVRLSKGGACVGEIDAETPLVIFGNHSSWWDPMIAVYLGEELFGNRTGRSPIDAEALSRYPFLRKLGFFGVDREHGSRGAATFIRTVTAAFDKPNALLWMTPQGRFADARERPVSFEPGLAHIPKRVPHAILLPMALEYVFWEERYPEALIQFGDPVSASALGDDSPGDADSWNAFLEDRLRQTQDALAAKAMTRCPEDFTTLFEGRAGTHPVYDLWRAARAKLRGQGFHRSHGDK